MGEASSAVFLACAVISGSIVDKCMGRPPGRKPCCSHHRAGAGALGAPLSVWVMAVLVEASSFALLVFEVIGGSTGDEYMGGPRR